MFHHFRNRVGTLRARISEATGAVVERFDYDAYGRQRQGSASPVGFSGGYHDADSGLVFLRSRWYSPHLARFVSRDSEPMVAADPRSINRYAYNYGDPVNRLDLTGQVSIAEVVVNLAIANALAVVTFAVIVDGWEAVTSALGLADIPSYFGERKNARFLSLRDLVDTPLTPRIPAVGGLTVSAGPLSVGIGYEGVRFDAPAQNALYITAGSGFGKTFRSARRRARPRRYSLACLEAASAAGFPIRRRPASTRGRSFRLSWPW